MPVLAGAAAQSGGTLFPLMLQAFAIRLAPWMWPRSAMKKAQDKAQRATDTRRFGGGACSSGSRKSATWSMNPAHTDKPAISYHACTWCPRSGVAAFLR